MLKSRRSHLPRRYARRSYERYQYKERKCYMEHSKLTWEDIIKFEEVAGYGQHIWKHGEQYYLVVDEGGISEQRVVYELPLKLFQKVKLQKFLELVVERRLNLEHLLAGTKKWDY